MTSDPVLGNATRWHSTSPLYGEEIWIPQWFGMGVFWEGASHGVFARMTDAVCPLPDASRHDL